MNTLKCNVTSLTAYEVRGETDTTEGRGSTYIVGYFNNKTAADEAAAGKGVWGAPGYVKPISLIEIEYPNGSKKYYLDSPIQIKSITDHEMKCRAQKKLKETLTPDEISALGIKV